MPLTYCLVLAWVKLTFGTLDILRVYKFHVYSFTPKPDKTARVQCQKKAIPKNLNRKNDTILKVNLELYKVF